MDNTQFDALKLENQMCFPLYAAAREVMKLYRPYLDELNLTYTQYITMMVVWEHRSCSVKELGEKLHLDSGTLTPVVKSLEQKGFVRRFRSKEDERVLLVEITDDGMKLREQAAAVPPKIGACIRLTPEEAGTLYRLLYKVLGNS
ncbi:MAG: MarR family transcriptional regulator [Ruminococcus sp.]|nr:MarR family transcriptional regulator [Ruminococcus sp.]